MDASEPVEHWRKLLRFEVPRELATRWLKEFGAWPLESDKYATGLNQMSDDELAEKVLWLACIEATESRYWHGLTR